VETTWSASAIGWSTWRHCWGADTPPRRIPVWVARLAGGEGLVHMMTRARGSSNVKAKTGLGWAPLHPDWRAGFTDELMVAQ